MFSLFHPQFAVCNSAMRPPVWAKFAILFVLVVACVLTLAGCDDRHAKNGSDVPEVLAVIGATGSGPGEFIYPRAIDIETDGSIYVVDKTGRVQHLAQDGKFLDGFSMPEIEAGKPTGVTIGPDGNIYVADTHYHRVMVYDTKGKLLRQFGHQGTDGGGFIYPTDVAFVGAGDGKKILVTEYGGNDRISVFTPDGKFISSFGSLGSGDGQFSRPAAMAVDEARNLLYVADACNHRIAVYDIVQTATTATPAAEAQSTQRKLNESSSSLRSLRLGGDSIDFKLKQYIGSPGSAAGQLRYPYGLALMADGMLVVCEYGNNRLQTFDAQGRSMRIYGGPGRDPGQLAFPWAVAVDRSGTAYVVDAGNNRVQKWRL